MMFQLFIKYYLVTICLNEKYQLHSHPLFSECIVLSITFLSQGKKLVYYYRSLILLQTFINTTVHFLKKQTSSNIRYYKRKWIAGKLQDNWNNHTKIQSTWSIRNWWSQKWTIQFPVKSTFVILSYLFILMLWKLNKC